MRWAIATIALVGLSGCAESTATRANALAASGADQRASVARLEHKLQEQEGRVAELEARIALLEQEGRQARAPAQLPKPGEPLRIASAATPDPWKTVTTAGAALERLPVVPLPNERESARGSSAAVREQYRAALRLVNEGRWDDALPALAAFLSQYPHDELADNARYWRGEVHYSQRHYEQAIADFQGVLARYPGSDKAPDCLLKMGMSHLRLGHRAEATRYFDQVREQYPKSDAARAAANEGSS